MQTTKTFIFMGRPGCGKGTQIDLLVKKFPEFETLHLGNIFREVSREQSFLGQKIKGLVDAGHLAPHWFASYLFKNKILHMNPEHGVFFEGTARKLAEARDVAEVLEWLERPYRVIVLEVPASVIKERLEGRAKTEHRADDHVRSIDVRLEEYETHTVPSIQFFKEKGLVITIDGTKSFEEVHAAILSELTALP